MQSPKSFYRMVVLLLLLQALPAEAYLDPGSGSLILQAALAGLAAAYTAFRLFWHRVSNLFRRERPESDS